MSRRPICDLTSSAYFAGHLRPCGLLSTARGPALARALPLALALALGLAFALAVALAFLRAPALALALPLALRLGLPLVFALASASFMLAGSGHMAAKALRRDPEAKATSQNDGKQRFL